MFFNVNVRFIKKIYINEIKTRQVSDGLIQSNIVSTKKYKCKKKKNPSMS